MILVNNPGSWSYIYPPLKHAPWHGCTPTDLVFPFFLFAVGNAMAFVMPKLQQAGQARFWSKIIRRTLLIFFIGYLLNWSPFVKWDGDFIVMKSLEKLRIMGVLQRIAICYFFASVIAFYAGIRGSYLLALLILLFYWALCFVAGDPSDPYGLNGWFGTSIDKMILGENRLYAGEGVPFDPEGLMSSFAAISQVLFGYLAGNYIIHKGKNFEAVTGLFVTATLLTLSGLCWDLVFPMNKKIWTSSYTLYTSGLALYTIAMLIYLIELKKVKGFWIRFFDVFGKNPLFIFVLSGFLPRALALIRIPNGFNAEGLPKYLSPFSWYYENIAKKIPGIPENGSLFYALTMIVFFWAIANWMDRKKIYIKV
jgi:predicted acyltransferase